MVKPHQGHTPRKRFGQNFLVDQIIIQQIIQHIAAQPEDVIVEIGPGLGALTEHLVGQCRQLHLIELDRDLAAQLRHKYSAQQVNLYNEDALKFDYSRLSANPHSIRVIGNLPYNISTPLIFHLLSQQQHIQSMHFMLQKELVDRITAAPQCKAYGRLSVMVQFYCEVEKLIPVPPHAFKPQPKVDSSVLKLTPKPSPQIADVNRKKLDQIVKLAFNQRRKTLRNSLKGALNEDTFNRAGIDSNLRAENLSVADYVRLSQMS